MLCICGIGLVSYQPSQVAPALMAGIDHWLLTRLECAKEQAALAPLLQGSPAWPALRDQLATLPRGQAYLWQGAGQDASEQPRLLNFHTGHRHVPHIRHLHKYLRAALPSGKRFYFHDGSGRYLGRVASNLWEFLLNLELLPLDSLQYHLGRGDFARWVGEVLRDQELARWILRLAHRSLAGDELRQTLVAIVRERYNELDSLV